MNPAALLLSSSVATLRSSSCSILSKVEVSTIASQFTMSEAEWSHSSTFCNSTEQIRNCSQKSYFTFIKLIFACIIVFCLMSCKRKPFVEHNVKFEKVSDDCKEQQTYFRINSNFGGERYEFEKCLAADINKNLLTTERRGDTVVVNLPASSPGQKNVLYHVTLDIDSYPLYRFLSIGEDTFTIIPSEK